MPFDDNRMKYSFQKHRYILTEEHVLESMNIDLRDVLNTSASADVANAVECFLDRVSREVYAFIYRVAAYRYKTERALAHDPEARLAIQEAMEEQVLYLFQNGDISAFSGINLQTGITVDKSRMRAAEIAPLAYDIIMSSGYVSAIITRGIGDISPRYTEEGY